jgi:type I restriction-modification system DNA methylase subunit
MKDKKEKRPDFERIIKAIGDEVMSHIVIDSLEKSVDIEEIGNIFEKSLNQLERKDKGQYYTPREIVKYMVSCLKIDDSTLIIDPACGCGSFLLHIIEKLKSKNKTANYKNIYGVDRNSLAVKITRLSIAIKAGFKRELITFLQNNIRIGNSIVSYNYLDNLAFQWRREFPEVFKAGGFDIVIGNPPYVTLRTKEDFDQNESLYSQLIKGPVNAATLMIGRGLEILKPGGILAFVLPKTLLHVESYSRLREYLLKNTKIIEIFDLGLKFKDVRGEQIILIIKREKPFYEHEVQVRIIKDKSKSLFYQPRYKIPQGLFMKNNKMLIFDNMKYYFILDKIMSGKTELSKLVNGLIFRGLPIGGNSKYITREACNNSEIIIRGKSISKFKIKNIDYINKEKLYDFAESKINILRQKKIILQNIFSSESGIIAAYDNQGFLTLDTVTNIIINNDLLAKYILCLLHSKLINFYVMYGLYNSSRLTMHADRIYIGKIPVVENPKIEYLEQAINYVDDALNETVDYEIKKILRKIDVIVYKIYNLDSSEINLIERAVNRLISKKSRW